MKLTRCALEINTEKTVLRHSSCKYSVGRAWAMVKSAQNPVTSLRSTKIDAAKISLFVLLVVASVASLALLYPFSFRRALLAVSLYALGTGVTLFLLFHPRNRWLVANRSRVDRDDCVALTFDDGPDPVDTPRLLDLLREKDVKATFFVVGERAERHPEIVRRAWEEGHLIANHTWSHPNLFCFLTPRRLRSEIARGTESIRRICGFETPYFRSPVGLRHALVGPYLKEAGLEFISWRIRSYDTITMNPSALARRILKKVAGGDIILLHDRLPSGTEVMLDALPGIIDELRRRGFGFALVGPRKVRSFDERDERHEGIDEHLRAHPRIQ
jgi:peptidoglycan/xylan/chitin deacetylase (PgdA/CDA1 family)